MNHQCNQGLSYKGQVDNLQTFLGVGDTPLVEKRSKLNFKKGAEGVGGAAPPLQRATGKPKTTPGWSSENGRKHRSILGFYVRYVSLRSNLNFQKETKGVGGGACYQTIHGYQLCCDQASVFLEKPPFLRAA